MDLISRIFAIQEKINLDKVFGSGGLDINDDVNFVVIGGVSPAVTGTSWLRAGQSASGFGASKKIVPTGKVLIPLRWEMEKYTITTDKEIECVLVDLDENDQRAKTSLVTGEFFKILEFPMMDEDNYFAAGEEVRLYYKGSTGISLFIRQRLVAMEIDA